MSAPFAIAEAYVRADDADPTRQVLERLAVQLEKHTRGVALEVFGHGLTFEILAEPGSIIQRCKAFAGAPLVALTLLGTDYSLVEKNVDALYQASISFSDKIIAKVVREMPTTKHQDGEDRSVTVRRASQLGSANSPGAA
jgi:hypothetical protein